MKDEMKFIITKGFVEIVFEGRTARFSGEVSGNGFAANANSMEWVTPEESAQPTDHEKAALITAAQKHFRWKRCKIFFVDEHGKKVKLKD
ncbi:MAG: hypothetical protein IIY70_02105 [Oscillospiraceae bacterium]|nr:hypothetical protein [Oscillospiraceae bacterium]